VLLVAIIVMTLVTGMLMSSFLCACVRVMRVGVADTSKTKDPLDWSTGLIVAPQVFAALTLWNLSHSFGHYKDDRAVDISKGVLAPMARATTDSYDEVETRSLDLSIYQP